MEPDSIPVIVVGGQPFPLEGRGASSLDAAITNLSKRVTRVHVVAFQAQLESLLKSMAASLNNAQRSCPTISIAHFDFSIGVDASGELGLLGSSVAGSTSSTISVRLVPTHGLVAEE